MEGEIPGNGAVDSTRRFLIFGDLINSVSPYCAVFLTGSNTRCFQNQPFSVFCFACRRQNRSTYRQSASLIMNSKYPHTSFNAATVSWRFMINDYRSVATTFSLVAGARHVAVVLLILTTIVNARSQTPTTTARAGAPAAVESDAVRSVSERSRTGSMNNVTVSSDPAAAPRLLKLCELVSNKKKYDHQYVRVQSIMRAEGGRNWLYDPTCQAGAPVTDVFYGSLAALPEPLKQILERNKQAWVMVEGTFYDAEKSEPKALLKKSSKVYRAKTSLQTRINLTRVVEASPTPPTSDVALPVGTPVVCSENLSAGEQNSQDQRLPCEPAVSVANANSFYGPNTIMVSVLLDEAGKIISARAVAGEPRFYDQALKAVRAMTFAPKRISGQPVKTELRVKVVVTPETKQ
jgi:Gram-negative bacterial TonB protein C-terminal